MLRKAVVNRNGTITTKLTSLGARCEMLSRCLVLSHGSLRKWGQDEINFVDELVVPRMGSQITANSYNFDVVKEFIYLGTAINSNNNVSRFRVP